MHRDGSCEVSVRYWPRVCNTFFSLYSLSKMHIEMVRILWYCLAMVKRKAVQEKMVAVPPSYSEPRLYPSKPMQKKTIVIGILALALIVLLVTHKGWFVAAVVDGKPIFSWQLNSALRSRFGQQTLEGMIGEMLIAQRARVEGVVVSKSDVDKKQAEVLGSLGENVKLDDLLKFQGLTKADFENQLKLQLTVERLLTKNLSITDTDIDAYIATNRATLVATDPAKLKEEAKQAIKTNIVNEKLQTWFTEIRKNAKVLKFL